MNIWHDFLLAIIQGLTEFLPVSSSAHLIIIPEILSWEQHSVDFDIAVHLGTLCAVLFYFRDKLLHLFNPLHPLTNKLIIATLPVCITGFLLKEYIEIYLRSPVVIAVTSIVFGLLLGYSQYKETDNIHSFKQINYFNSFIIGLSQCLALIPGTSRSGITITAALFLGLDRKNAAEFSFLMSIPVIVLASGMLVIDIIRYDNVITTSIYSYLIGFSVSATVAMFSMYFFIKLVERIGMLPFVVYRVILGCFLLYLFV